MATDSASRPAAAASATSRSTRTSSSPARGEVEPGRQLVEMVRRAVGDDPDEAERAQVLDDRLVRQPGHGGQGKRDLNPGAGHGGQHVVGRALGRVPADRRAAGPAVAPADPRPEEAQVVVHFGGRADGGAAADDGVPLLDRHRRREALEVVHQRLGHPLEELLGVGRERLDVPPLALGVERVEGERALAGARGSGDDGERPVRQLDGDSLQVVLPGVDDADHRWEHNGFGDCSGDGEDGGREDGEDGEGRPLHAVLSLSVVSVVSVLSVLSLRPLRPLYLSASMPRLHAQVPPPRIRDLRPGLARGLRDHADLRQRLSGLSRGDRAAPLELAAGGTGPGVAGLDRRAGCATGSCAARVPRTRRSRE